MKSIGLTTIWFATNPRSSNFSSVLVNAPALAPVTLLLPVVAVFIAAGDESTCKHARMCLNKLGVEKPTYVTNDIISELGNGNNTCRYPENCLSSHIALSRGEKVTHAANVAAGSIFYEYKCARGARCREIRQRIV